MSAMDPLIGQQIGNYVIKRKIGEGGMAVVYLADDTALKRDVVIKMMLPRLAQQEALRLRFQREARATAQLHHQNIVPVYTTGNAPNGQPYIAFQYVEGGALSDQLRSLSGKGQWISVIYALSIARQIADALIVAHKANIIHRDLKPSNILLRKDGTPVLSDLGIAAVQQATVHLTQTGGILGTPDYMSPEQAGSQAIDGRSDIYSLGVILHELLSGQLPFDADSPWAMVHNHIYEQPTPLKQVRTGLTAQTYRVVETCLQKKPDDRFMDAAALVAALDEALAAENGNPLVTVTTLPPTMVEGVGGGLPPAPPVTQAGDRQRPLLKIAFSVLGLLLLAAIIFLLWQNFGSQNTVIKTTPDAEIVDGQRVVETATAVAPTPVPATDTPPPTTEPTATTQSVIVNTVPPASTIDDSSTSAQGLLAYSCGPDGLGEIFLYTLSSGSEARLSDQPINSLVPSFAHDGQQIAYRSNINGAWQIFVSNIDGSNRHTITNVQDNNYEAVWSPDDSRFAFVSDRTGEKQIYMMNSDGTNQQRLSFSNAYEDDPTWSVNDDLAFESNRNGRYSIYQQSVFGGSPQLLATVGASSTTPAWSPDGGRIAFEVRTGEARDIWLVNRDGTDLQRITSQGSENQRPAWSPEGRFLAFHSNLEQATADQFDIWIIELDSGDLQRITYRGDCYDPAWGGGGGATAVTRAPQIVYAAAEDVHVGDEAELDEWPPLYGLCYVARFNVDLPIQYLQLELETWGVTADNPIKLNGQTVTAVPLQGAVAQAAWTPVRTVQLPGDGLRQGANSLEICANLIEDNPDFAGDHDDFRFRNLQLKAIP